MKQIRLRTLLIWILSWSWWTFDISLCISFAFNNAIFMIILCMYAIIVFIVVVECIFSLCMKHEAKSHEFRSSSIYICIDWSFRVTTCLSLKWSLEKKHFPVCYVTFMHLHTYTPTHTTLGYGFNSIFPLEHFMPHIIALFMLDVDVPHNFLYLRIL